MFDEIKNPWSFKKGVVVFHIETNWTSNLSEQGKKDRICKCGVAYSYDDDKFHRFKNPTNFVKFLNNAKTLVSYNGEGFDFLVLEKYGLELRKYKNRWKPKNIKSLDILHTINERRPQEHRKKKYPSFDELMSESCGLNDSDYDADDLKQTVDYCYECTKCKKNLFEKEVWIVPVLEREQSILKWYGSSNDYDDDIGDTSVRLDSRGITNLQNALTRKHDWNYRRGYNKQTALAAIRLLNKMSTKSLISLIEYRKKNPIKYEPELHFATRDFYLAAIDELGQRQHMNIVPTLLTTLDMKFKETNNNISCNYHCWKMARAGVKALNNHNFEEHLPKLLPLLPRQSWKFPIPNNPSALASLIISKYWDEQSIIDFKVELIKTMGNKRLWQTAESISESLGNKQPEICKAAEDALLKILMTEPKLEYASLLITLKAEYNSDIKSAAAKAIEKLSLSWYGLLKAKYARKIKASIKRFIKRLILTLVFLSIALLIWYGC